MKALQFWDKDKLIKTLEEDLTLEEYMLTHVNKEAAFVNDLRVLIKFLKNDTPNERIVRNTQGLIS